MVGLFKRVNFFKGLFMKTEDWKTEQEYHMEKQRFHNKYLHTPGVVFNCLEGLRVSVSPDGTTLTVAPGYAIDGDGRDLYVPKPKEIKVPDLQSFNPPCTIYISISYCEKLEDQRENTSNPMYTGYAFVSEDTIIEITGRKPDNFHHIELGRVNLSENATRILDAGSIDPQELQKEGGKNGEGAALLQQTDVLELKEVPEAGAMISTRLKGLSLSDMGEKLIDSKIVVIAGNRKQEDTNVLIEQYPLGSMSPMYMVFVQSLDGARTRWSVECLENDQGSLDYTLHIRNESNRTTTVMCRVYRVRV